MHGTTDHVQSSDNDAMRKRYEMLKARVEHKLRIEEGQAEALPFLAQAYGDTLKSSSMLTRATDIAQKFCIIAAGVIPILLFLRVAF
ncbi:hypothetical protein OCH239_18135 [Roseivivax halodurans JCM 10272]|uniref:Uncharacterized protein n=1 Tax=Roseivivax halodurans JCM 10272 TaxID=1449350 RepID=X7EH74_9RHOB|nr:hypothetical protein [Roseivivax halodurans]ETX15282.1 hypothetical protein OCH239_18135 [Roseivivax halodurans JCM 10272]